MLKCLRFFSIIILCLAVNSTTAKIYSNELIKETIEQKEKETEKEADSKDEDNNLSESYYVSSYKLLFFPKPYYISLIKFHYNPLSLPDNNSIPPIKPPILKFDIF